MNTDSYIKFSLNIPKKQTNHVILFLASHQALPFSKPSNYKADPWTAVPESAYAGLAGARSPIAHIGWALEIPWYPEHETQQTLERALCPHRATELHLLQITHLIHQVNSVISR